MPWHNEVRAQNWATPQNLYEEIERRFGWGGFTLDVCAEEWNAKCFHFFAEVADGLTQDWRDQDDGGPTRVWCNPPYDNIGPWVRKADLEVEKGHAELVVMLVPSRTGQPWFHQARHARAEFLIGRVNFDPPPGVEPKGAGAFEDSMLLIFSLPLEVRSL